MQKHVIYLVRHGQTETNVEGSVCGIIDSPLTEQGHNQAIEGGRKIAAMNLHVDKILFSPLSRAADTAMHIAEATGFPAELEPRLREQAFGRWEGVQKNDPDFTLAKTQFADSYEGGESLLKTAQRIYNLLDELKADKEHTYLLVAHSGISRVVQTYFRSMTNEEFAHAVIGNCELIELEFEE